MSIPAVQSIRFGVADGIATLTLHRPGKRNAIDDVTRGELLTPLTRRAGTAAHPRRYHNREQPGLLRGQRCAGDDAARLEQPASALAFNNWILRAP